MSTQLAKQISMRMKAKNLSILALEREAGLKTHAVRNILRGNSKRPSAEIVQAVADVLGCTVKELLENQEIFQENEEGSDSRDDLLQSPYTYPDLLVDTARHLNEELKQRKYDLTVQQVLTCLEETYLRSCRQHPEKVDKEFMKWFLNLVAG